jgi:hypothetical protein
VLGINTSLGSLRAQVIGGAKGERKTVDFRSSEGHHVLL